MSDNQTPGQTPRHLTEVLNEAVHALKGDKITFQALTSHLGTRAYGMILIIFALPNAIPIAGILGITALTGLLMLIFSVQMIFAFKKPWLPKLIAHKEIDKKFLLKAVKYAQPYLEKIEPYIKPRFVILSTPIALRLIGLFVAVFCMVMLLPLPFTNFIPSLAVFLVGLGMLEKDGLFALSGIIIGVLFSLALFFLMFELVVKLFSLLF